MKAMEDKKEKVVIRAVSHDEEGRKRVERTQLQTHDIDTLKYIEKKLMDKGVHRMERHPVDGLGGIGKPPPKAGRGGKYTWEGPNNMPENELDAAPPAIDEKDPNYVDEDEEKRILRDEEEGGVVVGEVEVAKETNEGVARVDVDPRFKD